MGIRGDPAKLYWVFTATFVVMLAAVPLYSAVVARWPRRRAVPWVYRFFVVNLVVFWALVRADVAPVWVARVFFVWVSVYNLFVVSVFWSLLADLFTTAQGKRLFGFVAAGGTAGALLGSATVAWLAGRLGVATLVLVSAAFLELAARCAAGLARWDERSRRAQGQPGEAAPERAGGSGGREVPSPKAEGTERPPAVNGALGGSAWAGFSAVARSPYLLGVAAQILLFSIGSTFLYFNLARTVAVHFPEAAARAALFAKIDLLVNLLALGTQSLATGRLVAALGVGGALAAVPVLSAAGFAAAALVPGFWVLGAFQTARRALHFAVDRPAREVLFTVVSPDEKYKAKSFVDTFVYRGGDTLAGWMHAGLAGLGLALPALSAAAIPFALASLGVALWLGGQERRREERPGAAGAPRGGEATAAPRD